MRHITAVTPHLAGVHFAHSQSRPASRLGSWTEIAAMSSLPRHCVVVGAGRMGSALAAALRDAGLDVTGPLRRGERSPHDADCVFLCVPDGEIGQAARIV